MPVVPVKDTLARMFAAHIGGRTMSMLAPFAPSKEPLMVKFAGGETVSVASVLSVTLPVTSTVPLFTAQLLPEAARAVLTLGAILPP